MDEWEKQKIAKQMKQENDSTEPVIYTEADIGEEVEITHEGIRYYDTIIEMWLPDGQRIIGPQLKCGHIFARFTMLPAMLTASENTKKMLDMAEGDA